MSRKGRAYRWVAAAVIGLVIIGLLVLLNPLDRRRFYCDIGNPPLTGRAGETPGPAWTPGPNWTGGGSGCYEFHGFPWSDDAPGW